MVRPILAWVAVFVTFTVLDFILHGVVLGSVYQASAELWRPEGEFMYGLIFVVVAIASACFVYIYAKLITDTTMRTGLVFGLLFGIANGVGAGYGTYAAMPIPYMLALGWFLGAAVEGAAAGVVAWLVLHRGSGAGA